MAQIYMFVYVLIIFLSLFLVIINCTPIPCNTPADCPKRVCIYPLRAKCINFNCECDYVKK
uniref:Late nodulin n=1 Tax=Medicago truncatula TaxID=3880 RepID=Q2HVT1_MEDTR|nr:Late nodulin [Medicago truncatula]ABN08924.1 Late nodulin [Medicago truncatula]